MWNLGFSAILFSASWSLFATHCTSVSFWVPRLIVFVFSDNLSAENSKLSAESWNHLFGCMQVVISGLSKGYQRIFKGLSEGDVLSGRHFVRPYFWDVLSGRHFVREFLCNIFSKWPAFDVLSGRQILRTDIDILRTDVDILRTDIEPEGNLEGRGKSWEISRGHGFAPGDPRDFPRAKPSPVRYINIEYRLSIYRHFWKISISIWSFRKISISIRQF